MPTAAELEKSLFALAPREGAADWDNVGLLVGDPARSVSRVLVALDITQAVAEEAIAAGCDAIVAHHPVIWGQIGQVTDETSTGRKLLTLIENGIAAICAHTNLDAAEGGVNSELARRMGLEHPVPLEVDGEDENGVPYGIGRVGHLPASMPLSDFAQYTKKALGLEGVRVLDAGVPVSKVAVGGGACGSMLSLVKAQGCDTFVTSDLKHDLYLEARDMRINLLDAGHYSTETVVCPVVKTWLEESFPGLSVEVARSQGEVFTYF